MIEIVHSLRTAWNQGGESALADHAQQLANSGVNSDTIYDSLEKLMLQLRSQGADESVEEHVMNVMDRVSGWCHSSRVISGEGKALPGSTRAA
jgi:hypothetical protein